MWGGYERKVSWAEQWVGVLSRIKLAGAVGSSHSAQFVALQQRELVGMGRAGSRGLSAHWALLCAQKLPAYGRSIRTLIRKKKKKKDFHWKKRCWKSTSHSVWEQFFQTQACVTPPLISNVVERLSSCFTYCIYDEPEVMTDSPVSICSKRVSIPWPNLGWGSMAADVFTTLSVLLHDLIPGIRSQIIQLCCFGFF